MELQKAIRKLKGCWYLLAEHMLRGCSLNSAFAWQMLLGVYSLPNNWVNAGRSFHIILQFLHSSLISSATVLQIETWYFRATSVVSLLFHQHWNFGPGTLGLSISQHLPHKVYLGMTLQSVAGSTEKLQKHEFPRKQETFLPVFSKYSPCVLLGSWSCTDWGPLNSNIYSE